MANDALFNVERPGRFSEVVGQENTIKSVQTALNKGVLEHALIFYGQTGGGKTTLARIVAKWLECDSKVNNEPCCQCTSCKSIKEGIYPDYMELNAATDGGKDDIDRLLENVTFAPQFGHYRIYVIDEAHCLTTSAWKSLLKILEEPPAHCYFIMCTTDFNSIPPEIKNRCGKYEFKRITKDNIFNSLKNLRIKYKANYTEDALLLLSESADGSMRNAVNNFSHISMPFAEGELIEAEDVKKYLSLVGPETMAKFVQALSERNFSLAVSIIEEEEKSAVGADNFLKMILNAISDSLTVSCGGRLNREVSEEYTHLLDAISQNGVARLTAVANTLNETYSKPAERNYSSLRIVSAQLCLLSSGSADSELVNTLIQRIERLEKGLVVTTGVNETVANVSETTLGMSKESDVTANNMVYEQEYSNYSDSEPEDIPDPENVYELFGEQQREFGYIPEMFCPSVDTEDCEPKESEESDFFSNFKTVEPEEKEKLKTENIPEEQNLAFEAPVDEFESIIPNPFETEPVKFGQYDGGIVFSSDSMAKGYAESQTVTSQAAKNLKLACEEIPLLKQLCNECCNCDTGKEGIILATPFEPVARCISAMLQYAQVSNVSVYPVDGLNIGG